jgi:hypothetical protein
MAIVVAEWQGKMGNMGEEREIFVYLPNRASPPAF